MTNGIGESEEHFVNATTENMHARKIASIAKIGKLLLATICT